MTDIYQIRTQQKGGLSIQKNDVMIVYNLDSADVQQFSKKQKEVGSRVIEESSADFDSKKPFDIYAPSSLKEPGRDLILAPHLHVLRSMVEHDPATTARDIEGRLRSLGVQFAALSAVTNLARKHGIKLAA